MTTASGDIEWLTPNEVRKIHDYILEPDQLPGEDPTRPIESALDRVKNQVEYEQIELDVLQIAASYAVVISRSHSFSDGNKRTAMMSMIVFLDTHGFSLDIEDGEQLGKWMEECAAGRIDDSELWSLIFDYITERENH